MIPCRECIYWRGHYATDDLTLGLGQCRRHAPQAKVIETLEKAPPGLFSAYWPETFAGDSCGEGLGFQK